MMDRNDDVLFPSYAAGNKTRPVVLIAQLMQRTAGMQHVDDVFLWLANAMAQALDVAVVQIWVTQTFSTGWSQAEARAVAAQNPALPHQIHTNRQMAMVVERLLREQRGVMPLPVAQVFSSPQAYLLAQHNLHYWAGCFMRNNALLPPMKRESSAGKVPTPLSLVISLFTSAMPSPNQLRTINFLLDQTTRIAISRSLLIAPSVVPPTPARAIEPGNQPGPLRLTLPELIPQRAQNIEEMQVKSPFASAQIIANKHARRVYSLIDGQRNVSDLAYLARLDEQEITEALRYLLHQQQIRLYEPGGKPVESSAFLPPPS